VSFTTPAIALCAEAAVEMSTAAAPPKMAAFMTRTMQSSLFETNRHRLTRASQQNGFGR
jgi:hypothetical protein